MIVINAIITLHMLFPTTATRFIRCGLSFYADTADRLDPSTF